LGTKVEEHEKPQPVQAGAVGAFHAQPLDSEAARVALPQSPIPLEPQPRFYLSLLWQLKSAVHLKNSHFDPAIRLILIRRQQKQSSLTILATVPGIALSRLLS